MFKEVSINRASTEIVDQVKKAVLTGELAPGSKLPSQRELQQVFKVSRPIVTESLRVLEKMGLIIIKSGAYGGAIVSNSTPKKISELIDISVKLEDISIKDLTEYREHFESINVVLAAQRRSEEDLLRLKKRLEQMRILLEGNGDWSAFIEVDSLFHLDVAEATKNRLAWLFLKVIWHNLLELGLTHVQTSKKHEIFDSLADLVNAIERKEPAEAAQIMRSHIHRFNEDLFNGARTTPTPTEAK